MSKLYENTFRAVNIALAFEMADACRVHRLDPIEVTEAAASKPSGFLAHHPSAGVGGAHIGVDPHYLLAAAARARPPGDDHRGGAAQGRRAPAPGRLARARAARALGHAAAKRPACWSSARHISPAPPTAAHAPAVEIITRLAAEGIAVDYHDPLVPELRIDGEMVCGVDPDPRRDASGFGPEDYDAGDRRHRAPGL